MALSMEFSAEGREIYNDLLDNFSLGTKDQPNFTLIRQKTTDALVTLTRIDETLRQQRLARERLKRLKRSIGFSGSVSSQKFLEAIRDNGFGNSRTLKSEADVIAAQEKLLEQHDETYIKSAMINSYKLIMEIRSLFKEPIIFGTTMLTRNSEGKDQLLFEAHTDFEQIAGKASLKAGGALQISATVADLKAQIANSDSTQKYQNLLDDAETSKIWNTLKQVKEALNKKKISYSYGQLIEALAYLHQKSPIEAKDVFQALVQGRNRVSFEVEGDFKMLEKNLQQEIDVQSKLFNLLGPDEAQRNIRILTITNCIRVLTNINEAVTVMTDKATMKSKLASVFEASGKVSGEWASNEINLKIQEIVNKVLENQVLNNLKT